MSDPLAQNTAVLPFMERPLTAALLASGSGALDAWSLTHVQSFATVQSGNVVSAGYDLVSGRWEHLAVVATAIAAFGLGSFFCAVVVAAFLRANRRYTIAVLIAEAMLLSTVIVLGTTHLLPGAVVACCLSFIAGAQGNAFHRVDGMLYGNIAVTFPLQAASSMLGRALMNRAYPDGEQHLRHAGVYAIVLAGFAAGGAAGYAAGLLWSYGAIAIAAVIVVVLAATTRRHAAPDPEASSITP